jgi:hypothetical protein
MKPILLLAPAPKRTGRRRERRRLDLRRVARLDAVDDADYASVIVLNDGGAATIRRLQLALALRAQHERLPVAVLTYLEPPDAAAAGDALAAAAAAPRLALPELGPELFVELKDEMLSLEYQAH